MDKLIESDLFEPVKEWLEERGFEVFAEVKPPDLTTRADVIATNTPVVAAVEMKTSLSLSLISQAIKWREFCHYVYIAVPATKKGISDYTRSLLVREGIGLIEVVSLKKDGNYSGVPYNSVLPKLNRKISPLFKWEEVLLPEHKVWTKGGSDSGGHVTPYKLMIKKVKEYMINQDRWLLIEEILNDCETYYSTPKPSLSNALRNYEHKWCDVKKENKRLYYRVKKGEV